MILYGYYLEESAIRTPLLLLSCHLGQSARFFLFFFAKRITPYPISTRPIITLSARDSVSGKNLFIILPAAATIVRKTTVERTQPVPNRKMCRLFILCRPDCAEIT